MGNVTPVVSEDGSTVWYPNPMAMALLVSLPLCAILGMLIALPYFLHVFRPIAVVYIGIPVTLIGFLIFLYLVSRGLILGSEIGEDYVLLKYLFKRRRIGTKEVSRVTIDPPVYSDSLNYTWWGEKDSRCWIEFRDGEKLLATFMPNGVKLRMARVLDPENFPSPSESHLKVE